MDIAVIMPTFNRARYLPSAIDSALAQTIDVNVEIIVIDDGSTDDTPAVCARYGNAIRYLRQENQGVVAARNHGLAQTSAPLVAFLDSDDYWQPTKLAAQLEAMRAGDTISVVHTSFRYVDDRGSFTDDGPQRMNNPCTGDCVAALLREDLVIFSSVLARRSAIDAAAAAEPHGLPFAPGLTNAQDYDLLLRLARLGSFAYLAEPLTCYRRHDAHGAMSNLARAYGYHCRVQRDFVRRWGKTVNISDAQADESIADFLFGRAESAFWRRDFGDALQLCAVARQMNVSDDRFASLERKCDRPAWLYRLRDGVDRLFG